MKISRILNFSQKKEKKNAMRTENGGEKNAGLKKSGNFFRENNFLGLNFYE